MQKFTDFLKNNKIALVYFSNDACNVCHVLAPKIENLIINKFPKIVFKKINSKEEMILTGQLSIFTFPTILLFIEGKEYFRKSRYISLIELEDFLFFQT